ncbi:cytoskeletal protein-binding protein [Martiniozyma asiatica (nom. inval.)]|nr:cytoskeletal protein-binding protein [Martiniozyma asiatica]
MSSAFIGVYKALYDYAAQNDEELSIAEGDIIYLLQKSDFDDWWTVKKRVIDANEEEPQGLVPSTYIEPAPIVATATAMYDYDRQTDEELTFSEGAKLNVYDTSDPNWTLVGISNDQFGFVPGNYIELDTSASNKATNDASAIAAGPILQAFPPPPQRLDISSATPASASESNENSNTNISNYNESNKDLTVESDTYSDEAPPPMPTRPTTTTTTTRTNTTSGGYPNVDSEPRQRERSSSFFGTRSRSDTANSRQSARRSVTNLLNNGKKNDDGDSINPIHGDFAWKIHEIDGKKKRRGVLEIGSGNIYLDIENKIDETWPISKLTNYNNEKKHIFLDFTSPSYSFELHVSNKESAAAIISILGDMKGMQSEVALKDVKNAHNSGMRHATMKNGKMIYDFYGQGSDELTVLEGETIHIVNDKKSKEWWLVENEKGDRGVVPSNYVKIVDGDRKENFMKNLFGSSKSPKKSKSKSKSVENEREIRERARLEHEKDEIMRKKKEMDRRERELISRDREQREKIRRADERLRERKLKEQRKRDSEPKSASSNGSSKSLPNAHRVRTWIDRSGSFKVEAEFLGVQEGKIHLHKGNGVKIAVAAQKLSIEDLEYVERLTGTSLEMYKESKPKSTRSSPVTAANPKSKNEIENENESTPVLPSRSKSSAVQHQKSLPINAELVDYWFNFFVESGVDVGVCERYSRNFASEQVDEKVLPEITPALMRTLGVKEGDILRVKKHIDVKLGRIVSPEPILSPSPAAAAPPVSLKDSLTSLPVTSTLSANDDDWTTQPASKTAADEKITPQITGSIKDLLDVKPMEPTKTGLTPVKPVSTIVPGETTGKLKDASDKTTASAMPMMAMPTGFMPITMVPMMTGAMTGAMTGFGTNGLSMGTGMPITSFGQPMITGGVNSLSAQPQQKTGGFIMPLNTGTSSMPITSFGMPQQAANGFVKLQPTGVVLQKTGGNAIPAMQPTMRTGGFIPQSSFGMQMTGGLPQTSFGAPMAQMTGGLPQTSFGAPMAQMTGGLPQTSFGAPMAQMTGGLPQTSFGAPMAQMTGGLPQTSFGAPMAQMTGGLPQTSFGAPMAQMTGGLPQTSFGAPMAQMTGGLPQTSFGAPMAQMTGGLPQTSFGAPMAQMTGGLPQTSFGAPMAQTMPFGQQLGQATNMMQQTSLQPQPTGFGFGNASSKANLANATADNPFGF